MLSSALVAYVHFLAAFVLVVSICFEWITFNKHISLVEARRIQNADLVYGIAALVVLVFGFLRVFYFEKGSEFYFDNVFFLIKVFGFLLVGLLSIYPTIRFLKWRKETSADQVPVISDKECSTIQWSLRLEVLGLLIVIFSASMMAKGLG